MFSNLCAIRTLIETDTEASDKEKSNVLRALEGIEETSSKVSGWREREVVSFKDASVILGYSSTRAVHAAVRRGRLKGYYGGEGKARASGVLTSSIVNAIS